MALIMQDNQQATLSVAETDARGNPVDTSGTLSWLSSDETIVTVTDNGDGTATAAAAGALGLAQIQVQDSETDGSNIAGTLDVQIGAGPAVKVEITAGDPTDQAA